MIFGIFHLIIYLILVSLNTLILLRGPERRNRITKQKRLFMLQGKQNIFKKNLNNN